MGGFGQKKEPVAKKPLQQAGLELSKSRNLQDFLQVVLSRMLDRPLVRFKASPMPQVWFCIVSLFVGKYTHHLIVTTPRRANVAQAHCKQHAFLSYSHHMTHFKSRSEEKFQDDLIYLFHIIYFDTNFCF